MTRKMPACAATAHETTAEVALLERRIADLERDGDSACERLLARACRERLATLVAAQADAG